MLFDIVYSFNKVKLIKGIHKKHFREKQWWGVFLVIISIIILCLGLVLAQPSQQDVEAIKKANQHAVRIARSGEYKKALSLAEKTLKYATRALGKDHPDTLTSVNNLAYVYKAQGNYTSAELLYKRALKASERVLGKEHPIMFTSVNNLAVLYHEQGKHNLAEPMYKRALEVSERVLGKEHPTTLTSVNNLASLYKAQGHYSLAEPLYKHVLQVSERVLGKAHHITLNSINNLASLYLTQGRHALAEPLFKRALETSKRALGKEHLFTLTSVNNLANVYWAQGRYALAEPMLKRTFETSKRILGKEHPKTKTLKTNLEKLRKVMGQPLVCRTKRIGGGKSDAERQKEILSPQNPYRKVVAKITNDHVQRKILLTVLGSFKVDPVEVSFKKSVYLAPLCMDDLDFVELVMRAEELFNIKISDKELESITSKGRAAISLGSLESLIKSKQ